MRTFRSLTAIGAEGAQRFFIVKTHMQKTVEIVAVRHIADALFGGECGGVFEHAPFQPLIGGVL